MGFFIALLTSKQYVLLDSLSLGFEIPAFFEYKLLSILASNPLLLPIGFHVYFYETNNYCFRKTLVCLQCQCISIIMHFFSFNIKNTVVYFGVANMLTLFIESRDLKDIYNLAI